MLCCAVLWLQACDCLFGVLLVAGRVVAVVRGSAAPSLNVFDLQLLINFSTTNESLRWGWKGYKWVPRVWVGVQA